MYSEDSTVLPALKRMRLGHHFCGIYQTDADHRRIVVDFVRLGVERHEKILYLVNLQTSDQLKATLSAEGIDVTALLASGQLVIRSAREAYLADGIFDPEKMVEAIRTETTNAVAEGYSALRVTGEMTWALSGEPGTERLAEYESMISSYFATGAKVYSVCQYDQRRFDPDLLMDVLQAHPQALIGTQGLDNSNMYYVPPEALLAPDRSNAILETRIANLLKTAA